MATQKKKKPRQSAAKQGGGQAVAAPARPQAQTSLVADLVASLQQLHADGQEAVVTVRYPKPPPPPADAQTVLEIESCTFSLNGPSREVPAGMVDLAPPIDPESPEDQALWRALSEEREARRLLEQGDHRTLSELNTRREELEAAEKAVAMAEAALCNGLTEPPANSPKNGAGSTPSTRTLNIAAGIGVRDRLGQHIVEVVKASGSRDIRTVWARLKADARDRVGPFVGLDAEKDLLLWADYKETGAPRKAARSAVVGRLRGRARGT